MTLQATHTKSSTRPSAFLALALIILSALGARAALTDGLVSYWSMDATNGLTVPDLSFGNTMSIRGTSTTNAVGQFSNAMSFNGSTAAAAASGLTNMHGYDNTVTGLPIYGAGSYTITMWVKGPGQTNRYLFSESSLFHDNPLLLFRSGTANPLTNRLSILLRNNRGQNLIPNINSASPVLDNTWHHIAWVDDRGDAKLYVDGVPDGSTTSNLYSYVYAYNDVLLNTTCIGTRVSSNNAATFATIQPLIGTGQTFSGLIDEVGAWERALTLDEVNQVRTNGIYTQGTPVPSRAIAFTKVPANTTKRVGDWHLLSVDPEGNRPLTYQWYSNSIAITDATNRYLRVVNLQTNNSGDYYSVAVTNADGFAITTNATFTVPDDPIANALNGLVNYWPLDVFDANTNSPELHFGHYMAMRSMDTNIQIVAGQYSNAVFFLPTPAPGTHGIRTGGSPIYNRTNYSVALWVNGINSTANPQSDIRVFSEGSSASSTPLFTLGTANNLVGFPITASAYPFIRFDTAGNAPIVGRLTTRPVFDGNWHHLVWTDANGQGKMYVDGVLDETDYTYNRFTMTLDLTYIGATARVPAPVTPFRGNIDEVAIWSRVLSWTEIQQIMTNGVPAPGAVILAPTITTQPPDRTNDVFVADNVSFPVVVNGTPPFNFQWRKGNTPIDGSVNPTALTDTLVLTNVQLIDSNTTYSVVVTNESGSVTSSIVRLYVSVFVPVTNGEVLKIDVGLTSTPNPQPGFSEFFLGTNPGTFNLTRVTMTAIGTTLADRNRVTGSMVANNPPLMTQAQLYNDFVFANSAADGTGLSILIERLATNTAYGLTIWSFDPQSVTTRFADWSETSSGSPITITNGYTFDGAVLPTTDYQQTFGGLVTSSATGKLQFDGLKNGGASFGVFVNAIRLVANPVATGITKSAVVGGNLRLTTETEYPGMAPNIEQNTNLVGGTWVTATGGTIIQSLGPVVVIDFPIDPTTNLFYRGKRKPQ